jgi:hypothetical protein
LEICPVIEASDYLAQPQNNVKQSAIETNIGAVTMLRHPILTALTFFLYMLCAGTSTLQAADCEDTVARHMVGQALLAAQFVALAERVGMTPGEINAILKNISERSAKQEFWITDTQGRAYLTNTEVAFTFSSNSAKQPRRPNSGR